MSSDPRTKSATSAPTQGGKDFSKGLKNQSNMAAEASMDSTSDRPGFRGNGRGPCGAEFFAADPYVPSGCLTF